MDVINEDRSAFLIITLSINESDPCKSLVIKVLSISTLLLEGSRICQGEHLNGLKVALSLFPYRRV